MMRLGKLGRCCRRIDSRELIDLSGFERKRRAVEKELRLGLEGPGVLFGDFECFNEVKLVRLLQRLLKF